jgi:ATP-dependent RNA helicase RhlE
MTFEQLGLTEELLKAVTGQGYITPTPVQQKAIPLILEGRDVLAGAQTGTGKTASFTLPLLQRLAENRDPHQKPRRVRALILVPTRELAAQVNICLCMRKRSLAVRVLACKHATYAEVVTLWWQHRGV